MEWSEWSEKGKAKEECKKWKAECEKLKSLCARLKAECEKQRNQEDCQTQNNKDIIRDSRHKEHPVKWKVLQVKWDDYIDSQKTKKTDANPKAPTVENKAAYINKLGGIEIDLTEEVEDVRDAWDGFAIIARVIRPKQTRQTINSWAEVNWGRQVVLKFLPKGFFVTVFAESHERDHVLKSKNWFIGDHPVYMQPWMPNFNHMKLALYEKPVWVRLFNLPIKYWGDSSLEWISRNLGTLLEIDEEIIEKDLYTYARMKIAVVQKITDHITLVTANGKWRQSVEVEDDINPCYKCGSLLHQGGNCKLYVHKAYARPNKEEK
ncbi:hypothetical protein SUGI_0736970 [Cryptomeria japonica]|nr:hypothetical protein SUGI_0736970 [Cryptomeria japonica]